MGRLALGERVRLYGRESERAAIDDLLTGARRSRGGALVLRSEPGGGKSALLGYGLASAHGMRVLRAVGVEPECDLPFAGLHQLLHPVLAQLDRVPDVQAAALRGALGVGPGGAENRFVIALAVLGLLAEVGADEPVLCLVDDAHWLDQPSADALGFVARRLDAERVALLVAARTGEVRAFPAPDLPRREIPPLDVAAAEQLLVERFGAAIAPDVRRAVLHAAEGNPLALLEIPEALSPAQLEGRDPLPRPMPVGRELQEVFQDRVRRLSLPAQLLLLVAAAEGSGDGHVVLSAGNRLGIPPAAVAECEASGLLRVEDDVLVFRHPILRGAVYRTAPLTQRQLVHGALVDVLRGEADADRRAWHRAALLPHADDDIADELERTAGRARMRGGHAAACAALRRAAELTSSDHGRAGRLTAAARAAWDAGRPDEASALLDGVEIGDAGILAERRHLQGEIALNRGNPQNGAALLVEGAGWVARTDPGKALRMLFDAAMCANYAGDPGLLAEVGRRAAQLPIREAEPGAPWVELLVGVVAGLSGAQVDRGRLGRALDRVADADEPRWLIWAGAAAGVLGDQTRNQALCRRAELIARRSTAVGTLPGVLTRIAWTETVSGRVTSAAVCAEEGLRLAVETGLTNPATFHRAVLAWVAALRGDRALALTHAEQAADVARGHGLSPHLAVAGWAVGLLHLGSGEWEIAASRLEGLLQPGHEIGHPFIARRALPDLVEAAARADRPELARAAADRFENFGPAPEWELSLRARCRGLVSASVEERERLYREALALDERDPRPFARGRTLLLLGELLRRERRRAEARPHLRDAVDGFGRLGAVAWEKRARAELRATGETVRKLEPGTLEQLTPQQIQIARLVAAGATNKEAAAQLFLSPRTVDYHLRKVFIKLDIASRSELIRLGLADLESRPGIQPRWRGDGSGHVHRRDA